MNKLDKVLYVAETTVTGGREGEAKTADGHLSLKLAPPKEMGGAGNGVNPEQLFAAGYSACFMGAMKFVAGTQKLTVPANASIDGKVGIGPIPQGFGIEATLSINLPGMDRVVAQKLIEDAHKVCPYSNATRGNIEVKLILV